MLASGVDAVLYPLVVAVVSGLFAYQVAAGHRRRPKPYKAYWAAALAMSAAGSLAYAAAAAWTSSLAFKVYYLFAALLTAPYMALGSLFLAFDARWVQRVAWAVHVLSALGTALLLAAPVDQPALEALAGSSGRGVLEAGAWLPVMVVLNVFGLVGVVGVALYSALRPRGGRGPAGSLLLALGFFLVAMAGTVARAWPEWDGAFWVVMALGWAVAYGGYHVLSRPDGAARA